MEINEPLAEIEDTAARWLLRREGARWSPSDQAELDEWLGASTSHCVSFMRLGRVWREVGRLKKLNAELPHDSTPSRDGTRSVQSWRSHAEQLAIAAALLLTVALTLTAYLHRSQRFSTPVGGLSTVHTHDGSVITLNTDTQSPKCFTSR
jgi:transmembrane sensor